MSTRLRSKGWVCLAVALLAPSALRAQSASDPPYLKTELFAGFSTATLKAGRLGNNDLDAVRMNGWNFSATTYQFFRRWGLTAEAASYGRNESGVDANTQMILFGGTFRGLNKSRFALTGRIRAGVNRWNPTALPTGGYREQTGFAFGFGQSLDLKINETVAVRFQPDLTLVRRKAINDDHRLILVAPLSFGLVLKFGTR